MNLRQKSITKWQSNQLKLQTVRVKFATVFFLSVHKKVSKTRSSVSCTVNKSTKKFERFDYVN